VGRGRTLRALLQFVRHLLTFSQRLEAAALDGRVMHEDVLAAVIRGNEAKTLAVVKPLHGSFTHLKSPIYQLMDAAFLAGILTAVVVRNQGTFRSSHRSRYCGNSVYTLHRLCKHIIGPAR